MERSPWFPTAMGDRSPHPAEAEGGWVRVLPYWRLQPFGHQANDLPFARRRRTPRTVMDLRTMSSAPQQLQDGFITTPIRYRRPLPSEPVTMTGRRQGRIGPRPPSGGHRGASPGAALGAASAVGAVAAAAHRPPVSPAGVLATTTTTDAFTSMTAHVRLQVRGGTCLRAIRAGDIVRVVMPFGISVLTSL